MIQFNSRSILKSSAVKPLRELIAMITMEVAMAFLIGTFMKIEREGMIIKPPPAPTNPLMKPIIPPKITKTVGLFFLVEGCSF
ncbi:hypothetical protein D3C86_1721640 [compost metagenome]